MQNNKLYYIILTGFIVQLASVNFSIALSSLAFGIWAILWLINIFFIDKKLTDPETLKENKLLLVFIGLFILGDIASRIAGGFNEPSHEGLKRHLLFFVLLFAIFSIRERRDLFKIIYWVTAVTAVISLYEIIVYFIRLEELMQKTEWGYIRIDYFSHPLTQGQIKMVLLIFLFPLLFFRNLPVNKSTLIAAYIPIFISMFLTQSRNVYLALAASIFIYGLIKNRKLIFSLTALVLLFLLLAPANFTSRITSIADPEHPSNRARLVMWEQSFKIFRDYPLLGVGERYWTFEELYSQYKVIEVENWGEGTHLHNNLLMIQANNGLVGLITFVAIFLIIFLKQIKYYRAEQDQLNKLIILGSILALVSFHIAGMFDYNFRDQKFAPLALFLIVIPFALNRFNHKNISIK